LRAESEKAPEPLWVRGPFGKFSETSVGRRTRANNEPEDGNKPDDDDDRSASALENRRSARVSRHGPESLLPGGPTVKFVRGVAVEQVSGEGRSAKYLKLLKS